MYDTGQTEIISSPLFDGRYSFTISRYNENEGSKRLGNGYIEISNGIMTVAKKGRVLETGSEDLYESFEGQVDNKGNIISTLKIGVLFGKNDLSLVDLNGIIDGQLQGRWDNYYDVILKLEKKSEPIMSSPLFDGRYSFTISRYNENEGSKRLGNGYIKISNGIMTVAKKGRVLETGSEDLYESFEGQVDNKGNIISTLKIGVLFGKNDLSLVDLNGSIDGQLQGRWDNYYDVILKLEKK